MMIWVARVIVSLIAALIVVMLGALSYIVVMALIQVPVEFLIATGIFLAALCIVGLLVGILVWAFDKVI